MKPAGWPTTSSTERDYGSIWQRLRLFILHRDNGLCQCSECKAQGRLLPASEVHHIVSRAKAKRLGWTKERTEDPSNLQAINQDCHKRETAAEQGRTLKPKLEIGEDGWPIKG